MYKSTETANLPRDNGELISMLAQAKEKLIYPANSSAKIEQYSNMAHSRMLTLKYSFEPINDVSSDDTEIKNDNIVAHDMLEQRLVSLFID